MLFFETIVTQKTSMNLPMNELVAPLSGEIGEKYWLKTAVDDNRMRLELSPQTLQRLLSSGQLCAADFRCLDCATKHCVWRLMARHCAHSLGCEGCCAKCGLVTHKTLESVNPLIQSNKQERYT